MKGSIASPMGQLTTKCQELGGGLATPREGVNRPRAARLLRRGSARQPPKTYWKGNELLGFYKTCNSSLPIPTAAGALSDAEPTSSMYQTATSPTPSSDAGYRSGGDAGNEIVSAVSSIGYRFPSAHAPGLSSINGSADLNLYLDSPLAPHSWQGF